MIKYVLTLSSGTIVHTYHMGRELVLGMKTQRVGPFVAVNFYAGPSAENASAQVEVNRSEVVMISPA